MQREVRAGFTVSLDLHAFSVPSLTTHSGGLSLVSTYQWLGARFLTNRLLLQVAPLLNDEEEYTSDMSHTVNPTSRLLISFQNENLTAELLTDDSSSKMLAVVPDLISVLDAQSGTSLGTHEYRYGVSTSEPDRFGRSYFCLSSA